MTTMMLRLLPRNLSYAFHEEVLEVRVFSSMKGTLVLDEEYAASTSSPFRTILRTCSPVEEEEGGGGRRERRAGMKRCPDEEALTSS